MRLFLPVLLFSFLISNVNAVEYATVVAAVEIKETRSVPSQHCENISVPVYGESPSKGGAIGSVVDKTFGSTQGLVGAITGGYIGSKFGRGSGRRVATVAGAAVGAQVGDRYDSKKLEVVGYENQFKCFEGSRTESINAGYHVIYDYRGQMISKVVKYKPVIGSKHPVEITVQ